MTRAPEILPRPAGRLFTPAVGDSLVGVDVPLQQDGTVLGWVHAGPRAGTPVRWHLFRERFGSVMLFGDLSVAAGVTAQVMRGGARVFVLTTRQQEWRAIRDALAVDEDRLQVAALDAPVPDTATFAEPQLVLQDGGAAAGPLRSLPGPWRTVLTVVEGVTPGVGAGVRGAQLVLAQRLTLRAARKVACEGLGLSEDRAEQLAALAPGTLIMMAGELFVPFAPAVLPHEVAAVEAVLARLSPRSPVPWRTGP